MIDLEYLEKRREELRAAEAQAIHTLGVVAGRLEEIELMIQLLKVAEPETEQ